MKKILSIVLVLFLASGAFAQVGISAGPSMLRSFSYPKSFYGVHIGVEMPSDDMVSYYGRLGIYSSNKLGDQMINVEARDPNVTTPNLMSVPASSTFNYTTLEGGKKYYIGSSYDYGWSGYGATHLMMAFNRARLKTADYDESLYKLPSGATDRGSIFNIAIGVGAGVKNSFTFGTLYFDCSLDYMITSIASNSIATEIGNQFYSPLVFSFNLGFRKDIY
jgi:hypothetical protein